MTPVPAPPPLPELTPQPTSLICVNGALVTSPETGVDCGGGGYPPRDDGGTSCASPDDCATNLCDTERHVCLCSLRRRSCRTRRHCLRLHPYHNRQSRLDGGSIDRTRPACRAPSSQAPVGCFRSRHEPRWARWGNLRVRYAARLPMRRRHELRVELGRARSIATRTALGAVGISSRAIARLPGRRGHDLRVELGRARSR